MLDAIGEGLLLLQPENVMYLALGVLVGTTTGLLPGLGGSVGMALLLPFIYGMEPSQAIAILVGIMAVNNTRDTFTSILVGVPGSSSSQATIMDGYPLTKRGEGARALGAALTGSMVGGVIGAIALVAFIPIARPLVLSLGSPELFMLTLVGISAVGILAGRKPIEGLLTTMFGLLLGMMGPSVAGHRFMVFDWDYLFGGISLVLVVLGLFAMPEILNLLRERTSLSRTGTLTPGGLRRGVRDVVEHKGLVGASSVGAVGIAIIPGMTGTAVAWLIYSLTKRFSRNNQNFGKGDIRGVIAPDSANNAMEGGALVPTLLFGIPSGAASAILLGGLILAGIDPGREMVAPANLPILLLVAWSLALANVFATALCLGASRWFARLSVVPPQYIVPAIFVVVIFGAFQNSARWGDIVVVMVLGVLGFALARWGWPRPPLLIGFVVGENMENYLRLSVTRYDFEWLTHPIVMAIGCAMIVVAFAALLLSRREAATTAASDDPGAVATEGPVPLTAAEGQTAVSTVTGTQQAVRQSTLREASLLHWVAWGLGLLLISGILGFLVGGVVWLAAFLRIEAKLRWLPTAVYLAGFVGLITFMVSVLGASLPPAVLGPLS